jgi:hypothetical protein
MRRRTGLNNTPAQMYKHAVSAPSSQSSHRFDEFRARVLAEPAVLERLRQTSGNEEFISATLDVARQMGFVMTGEEIEAALQAARRDWMERWLQ